MTNVEFIPKYLKKRSVTFECDEDVSASFIIKLDLKIM